MILHKRCLWCLWQISCLWSITLKTLKTFYCSFYLSETFLKVQGKVFEGANHFFPPSTTFLPMINHLKLSPLTAHPPIISSSRRNMLKIVKPASLYNFAAQLKSSTKERVHQKQKRSGKVWFFTNPVKDHTFVFLHFHFNLFQFFCAAFCNSNTISIWASLK